MERPAGADMALRDALMELVDALDAAHAAVGNVHPGPDLDADELMAVLGMTDEVEREITWELPRKFDQVVHELTEALRRRGMPVEQALAEAPAARARLKEADRESFARLMGRADRR
jgi:hypothetical protein